MCNTTKLENLAWSLDECVIDLHCNTPRTKLCLQLLETTLSYFTSVRLSFSFSWSINESYYHDIRTGSPTHNRLKHTEYPCHYSLIIFPALQSLKVTRDCGQVNCLPNFLSYRWRYTKHGVDVETRKIFVLRMRMYIQVIMVKHIQENKYTHTSSLIKVIKSRIQMFMPRGKWFSDEHSLQ